MCSRSRLLIRLHHPALSFLTLSFSAIVPRRWQLTFLDSDCVDSSALLEFHDQLSTFRQRLTPSSKSGLPQLPLDTAFFFSASLEIFLDAAIKMSVSNRHIKPKPPAILPNPGSMVPSGKSQRYNAPNAGTVENQPVVLVKHPLDSRQEVTLEDAVAAVDWENRDRVREFYGILETRYKEMGDWRAFMAQRAYDLTKDFTHAKEEFDRTSCRMDIRGILRSADHSLRRGCDYSLGHLSVRSETPTLV
jgi:hypothetical protein